MQRNICVSEEKKEGEGGGVGPKNVSFLYQEEINAIFVKKRESSLT